MVRRGGVEPPHPKAQRPQRCVSTIPPPAHKCGIKYPTPKSRTEVYLIYRKTINLSKG